MVASFKAELDGKADKIARRSKDEEEEMFRQRNKEYVLGRINNFTEEDIQRMDSKQRKIFKISNLPLPIQKQFVDRTCKYLCHHSPKNTVRILDEKIKQKNIELSNKHPYELQIETELIQRMKNGKIDLLKQMQRPNQEMK